MSGKVKLEKTIIWTPFLKMQSPFEVPRSLIPKGAAWAGQF